MSHIDLQQQAAAHSEYWQCPRTGIEMAPVPAGPFYAGHAAGKQLVTTAFSMARHPVTNAQWHQFVLASGYVPHKQHPFAELYLSHWNLSLIHI